MTDRYRKPIDLPPTIPVFPLQGCILLPRSTLPLNVFEPRYLEMLDDVLAGDRIIGIIQPAQPAPEGQESPRDKTAPCARPAAPAASPPIARPTMAAC